MKEQSQRQNLFKGGNHNILHYIQKGFKACLAKKDSEHQCSCRQLAYLSLHWALYFFCLMSHNKTQRQNISTKTALNSSQLIDRYITNGAKLINFPPESTLFGRSDKLVRDLFETKESVYKL